MKIYKMIFHTMDYYIISRSCAEALVKFKEYCKKEYIGYNESNPNSYEPDTIEVLQGEAIE